MSDHFNKETTTKNLFYLKYFKKFYLKYSLTWIIDADIVRGKRFRSIRKGVVRTLAQMWWRSMVAIFGEDGKQDHKQ